MIESFDYEEFAKSLKEQAEELLPEDLPTEHKEYIKKIMYNFVLTAGDALNDDSSLDFNMDDAVFICQVLAEWIFHKSIDLSRSGINSKYWDLILQKIAFAIFEVTKQGIQQKIEQQDTLDAVEHHVNKVYKESIDKLLERKEISLTRAEFAKGLSNIDKIAAERINEEAGVNDKEAANNDTPKAQSKLEKYAEHNFKEMKKEFQSLKADFKKYPICMTCAFFTAICGIKFLVNKAAQISNVSILNKIAVLMTFKNLAFILGIITICGIVYYLLQRWQIRQQLRKLENIRQEIQDLVNPDKQFERLGADDICLQIGKGLLCIADPDQDGTLLAENAALRQRLTDDLGYIIPSIHVNDSTALDKFEYSISIRGCEAATGWVYPDKVMVFASDWEIFGLDIPEDAIVGIDPNYKKQVYWVDENDIDTKRFKIKTRGEEKILSPVKIMIETMKNVVISHVDEILSVDEVKKYMDTAKEMFKSSDFVDDVLKTISLYDIKKIFINLIREGVSIKDIKFIVEKLGEFLEQTKEPDELSEKLRKAMARQICLNYADENRIIYAFRVSEKNENMLVEKKFNPNDEDVQEFLRKLHAAAEKAENRVFGEADYYQGCRTAILCSHFIRLDLFRLLNKSFPLLANVITDTEVTPYVKVEEIEEI